MSVTQDYKSVTLTELQLYEIESALHARLELLNLRRNRTASEADRSLYAYQIEACENALRTIVGAM